MAKVRVVYTARITEIVDWPDDEMDDFDEDNLLLNLNPEDNNVQYDQQEIVAVTVDGSKWEF